jgi:hypothetical protein
MDSAGAFADKAASAFASPPMRQLLLSAAAIALVHSAAAAPLWRNASGELPAKEGRGFSMNAKAGDVDNDGDLDLVVAMEFQRNRLLLNDGSGRFRDATAQLPDQARDSEEIALLDVDVDGDRDLDIVVANEDDLKPELYLNNGKGVFTDASDRLGVRVKANAVIAFDADGDKRPDLFFGGDKVSHLLMNKGRGRFGDESTTRLPDTFAGVQDVAAGDLDGDGDLDLVLGAEDRNQIYLNDGKGRFTLAPAANLPRAAKPEETRDVELIDADNDGDLDIFFANVKLWNPNGAPQNRLLLNDGQGKFIDVTAAWLPARDENTLSAQPADLNSDGRIDLITGSIADLRGQKSDAPLRFLINRGDRFEEVTGLAPEGVGANAFDILFIDLDGDAKPDMFVASRGGPDQLLLSGAASSAPPAPSARR